MRVVAFRHPSVGVAELRRDDAHRGERARIGVAKDIEGRGGFDLRADACRLISDQRRDIDWTPWPALSSKLLI
jgi:hypothetical protein